MRLETVCRDDLTLTVFNSDIFDGIRFPELLVLITVTHQWEHDVLNQNLTKPAQLVNSTIKVHSISS